MFSLLHCAFIQPTGYGPHESTVDTNLNDLKIEYARRRAGDDTHAADERRTTLIKLTKCIMLQKKMRQMRASWVSEKWFFFYRCHRWRWIKEKKFPFRFSFFTYLYDVAVPASSSIDATGNQLYNPFLQQMKRKWKWSINVEFSMVCIDHEDKINTAAFISCFAFH